MHASVKHAAGQYILGLLDLTQRNMRSSFTGVCCSVQAKWTKLLVCEELRKLIESVDRNFLAWVQCLVGDHIVKFLMECSPTRKVENEQREKIIKATNSVICGIFTSMDVRSTESTILHEIAWQNSDDKFLTSLVACGLERLAEVTRYMSVKENVAQEQVKKSDIPEKREDALDCVKTAAEEKHCSLSRCDSSEDKCWSVVAGPPSEPALEPGSPDSFSSFEYYYTERSQYGSFISKELPEGG